MRSTMSMRCSQRALSLSNRFDGTLATSSSTLGVDLSSRFHDRPETIFHLFGADSILEIELGRERLKNCADTDALFSGEFVPLIVCVITDISM